MDITFDEWHAPTGIARLAFERELHDVVGGHERRRQRPGHVEAIGPTRIPHRHVTRGVEYTLVGENTARRGKVFDQCYFHGITDT
jgi:hypothetical protein